MSQELRKLLTSQQADDNETSAWSVSIYLSIRYSSFWRGLTALSILCDVGNAKAFGSRMGREQHLRLFYILRKAKAIFKPCFFCGAKRLRKERKMVRKLFLFLVLFLVACSGNKQYSLEERIDSLQKENARKDRDINDMTTYVSLLADGLDSIAKQEDMLFYTNKGREGTIVDKEQLRKNLDMFEETLNQQRQRIAQLADSLKARGEKLSNLSRLVTFLNQQLDEKNAVINDLRSELQNKNVNISQLQKKVTALTEDNTQLNQRVETQVQALKVQTEIINEGFIKIGTKKALTDLGIITGGFLKKKKVNLNAIKQDQFMRVDIRYFKEIPLNSGDPKILTQMPASSYRITKTSKNQSVLYILDPTAFWSISNYLIVQL